MADIKAIIESPNDPNSPPIGIYGHSTCYGESKLYLYGGWVQSEKKYNNKLYTFDFEKLQWEVKEYDENFARSYHSLIFFEKKLFIVGGLQYEEIMKGIDVIDLETNKIDHYRLANGEVPPKYFHSTVLFNNCLYIYGGRTNSKKNNDVEVFSKPFIKVDLTSQTAVEIPGKDDDLYREKHGCFVTNGGNMYVIGGYTTKGEALTIKRFNIDSQKWFGCSNFDCPKNELKFAYFKHEETAISIYGNKAEEPMNDIYIYDVHGLGNEKMNKKIVDNPVMDQKVWGNSITAVSLRNGGSFLVIIGGENSKKNMIVCSIDNSKMKWEDMKKIVEEEQTLVSQPKIFVNEELYNFLKSYKLTHLIPQLLEAKINNYQTLYNTSTALLMNAGIKKGYALQLANALAKETNASSGKQLTGTYEYLTDCEKGEYLGKGSFGAVHKGMWLGTTPVAMKAISGALDDPAKLAELEKEASVTQLMKHPNLITMYGLYKDSDIIYMIIDLAEGSLDTLMKPLNPKNERKKITFKKQIKMGLDTASGMAYLESLRIVHRDLALRNLLYLHDGKGGYITKVADLGLSRQTSDGNYTTKSTTFPRRWTAPEAADPDSPTYLQFNSKCDVWSFGVCFWEILTKGEIPYSHIAKANDALEAVIKGLRLEKPDVLCENGSHGDKVWDVVMSCFNTADKRPRFCDCFKKLQAIYEDIPDDEVPQEESEEEPEDDGGYE